METIKPQFNSKENTFTDSYGHVLHKVHPQTEDCARRGCVVHCPSDHHMRDWPLLARYRWGGLYMERICEHGVGHPDPDHMAWYREAHGDEAAETEAVHGCCGCCAVPDLGALFSVGDVVPFWDGSMVTIAAVRTTTDKNTTSYEYKFDLEGSSSWYREDLVHHWKTTM